MLRLVRLPYAAAGLSLERCLRSPNALIHCLSLVVARDQPRGYDGGHHGDCLRAPSGAHPHAPGSCVFLFQDVGQVVPIHLQPRPQKTPPNAITLKPHYDFHRLMP